MKTGIALRGLMAIVLVCLMSVAFPAERIMAEDANITSYREHVMSALANHIEAIESIVEGKVGFAHHIPDHAVAIAGATRGLFEIYPEKLSRSGNGAAAPAPRQPSKFEATATQLNVLATRFVQAVATGDKNVITGEFKAVQQAYNAFLKEANASPEKKEKSEDKASAEEKKSNEK